jgi:hypothetical protein
VSLLKHPELMKIQSQTLDMAAGELLTEIVFTPANGVALYVPVGGVWAHEAVHHRSGNLSGTAAYRLSSGCLRYAAPEAAGERREITILS